MRSRGLGEVYKRQEDAIAQVIAEGRRVTYDMKEDRNDPTAVGTSQVGDAICEVLAGARAVSYTHLTLPTIYPV